MEESPGGGGGGGGVGGGGGGCGGGGTMMEGHVNESQSQHTLCTLSAPPPIVAVTLYGDLLPVSPFVSSLLSQIITLRHLVLLSHRLSPPFDLPWRPFPCSPFQNRSPRSLHHPRSVSPNPKRCKLLQSGGGAGRNPSPCMFEMCLSRLAVPPFLTHNKITPTTPSERP